MEAKRSTLKQHIQGPGCLLLASLHFTQHCSVSWVSLCSASFYHRRQIVLYEQQLRSRLTHRGDPLGAGCIVCAENLDLAANGNAAELVKRGLATVIFLATVCVHTFMPRFAVQLMVRPAHYCKKLAECCIEHDRLDKDHHPCLHHRRRMGCSLGHRTWSSRPADGFALC